MAHTYISAMTTLFVYYKLPVHEHTLWAERVCKFQQAVMQAWPGMMVELLQRPEPSIENLETWMEVYRHPRGVSNEMIAFISRTAQEMGLAPKRAAEIFVPLG